MSFLSRKKKLWKGHCWLLQRNYGFTKNLWFQLYFNVKILMQKTGEVFVILYFKYNTTVCYQKLVMIGEWQNKILQKISFERQNNLTYHWYILTIYSIYRPGASPFSWKTFLMNMIIYSRQMITLSLLNSKISFETTLKQKALFHRKYWSWNFLDSKGSFLTSFSVVLFLCFHNEDIKFLVYVSVSYCFSCLFITPCTHTCYLRQCRE